MANNTRDLKRRIRSVKNTAQLTGAMKMVSAAKLRRAQEQMMSSRPYAAALERVIGDVARRVSPELHPLLSGRELNTVDLVLIAGDKGLCGAFNANVIKAAEVARREHDAAGRRVEMTLIGKKAGEYYRRRPEILVREFFADAFREIDYTFAADLAGTLTDRFLAGETDGVFLVYNRFRTTISQIVTVTPIIPLQSLAGQANEEKDAVEYLYEPAAAELMRGLVPRFVSFQLYQAMLESVAAEHGARMAAMDNATRSAEDMISSLTLKMNRARQAAITTELIEVVSGAEAL